MNPVAFVALAYILGAIPTSYWVGRGVYGVDLRKKGSGNLGATNTFRVFGARAALPVVIFDIAKGWLPVAMFPGWAGVQGELGWALGFGAAAIFGHVFSLWVRFHGGKGVATSAGVFAALAPAAILICLTAFSLIVWRSRMVSLGSISAAALLPFAIWLTPHQGGMVLVCFSAALSIFVIWAHRSNLGRLIRGEENRFSGGKG